jgi:hypothetical protein
MFKQFMNSIMPGFPTYLMTGSTQDDARVKVDSQHTSFEEGKQFRFYDTYISDDAITPEQVVVYKITTENPVNLFFRQPAVHEGGRWLRVYKDADVTFTGTLEDSGEFTALNPRVPRTTGVTIQRAIGAESIFVTTSRGIDGAMAAADTNSNRAVPVYSPDEIRVGTVAGQVTWVMMEHMGSDDNLVGQLVYVWEELFDD